MPSWDATCSTMQRNPPEIRKTFTLRWCNFSTSSLGGGQSYFACWSLIVLQQTHNSLQTQRWTLTYLIPGVSWGGWSVIILLTCSREHLIMERRSLRAILNDTDPDIAFRVLRTKYQITGAFSNGLNAFVRVFLNACTNLKIDRQTAMYWSPPVVNN